MNELNEYLRVFFLFIICLLILKVHMIYSLICKINYYKLIITYEFATIGLGIGTS